MSEQDTSLEASVPDAGGTGLTREMLDRAFAAVKARGSEPRHSCRFDGHVYHFSLTGWYRCVYCGLYDAEGRP